MAISVEILSFDDGEVLDRAVEIVDRLNRKGGAPLYLERRLDALRAALSDDFREGLPPVSTAARVTSLSQAIAAVTSERLL